MRKVLWWLLGGARGGKNRLRVIRELQRQPMNANQLADALDLDYKTVRHHLDVLVDNDVVKKSGDDYGAVYLPTQQARDHWHVVEEVAEEVDA